MQSCTLLTDRRCLPDPNCYLDCPAGTYESRACSPPNLRQVCTTCSQCPSGSFASAQCRGKQNTVCQACTAAHCPSDLYNTGSSSSSSCITNQTSQCGVITESFGQNCRPNSYRVQNRIRMQDAWDSVVNTTVMNAAADHMAFDVSPFRDVYAMGYKNLVRFYNYTSSIPKGILAEASLPQDWMVLTDIRFGTDACIYVTVQHVDTVYKCDPSCPGGIFSLAPNGVDIVCDASPVGRFSAYKVQCAEWAVGNSIRYYPPSPSP